MKRIVFLSAIVFATLAPCARVALAQVTITPGSQAAAFAAAMGTDVATLQNQLQTQVNQLFQTANVGSFLRDFQNAQSFSAKGLGVDYASEATLVEVGATFSIASNIDKAYTPSGSYANPPISNGGANFSLMGGLGLGVFGIEPLMIFGNWFKGSTTLGQLDGDYNNWGVHGQLRLFGPSRSTSATGFLVRWGGIAITSGADYARLSLSTSKQITSTMNLPTSLSQIPSVTITSSGSLTFTVDQTTWSVPLEVTTSLRLLSLVTLYGGFGLDWQLGGGSNLNINMQNATLKGSFGNQTYNDLGTATIAASGHVNPSPARLREIVGIQINAMLVRLFFQVNVTGSSPMLASAAAGLRLAY
jgi:hypothetical protein